MLKSRFEKTKGMAGILLLCTLLAACGTPESRAEVWAWIDRRDGYSSSVNAMMSALSDATLVTQDPNSLVQQHGTQIEYHASNGKSYLWYPGNRTIVVGQWRAQDFNSAGVQLCYRYGSNAFNPVTKKSGGSWECSKRSFRDSDFLEGNPFKLKAGPVPFVIPDRRRYYPEHLVKWLGGDPTKIAYRDRTPYADQLLRRIELETQ
ncbi:hypothetical protein SAMN06265380_101911 [Ruegeria faecimaris]|uniref:Lipoprotein n=1 Tax=Ruegeria faecimaris TaxID=686389 RepID=A0A521BKP1_9RHOB|nr:hypothetical protein SAMN06265380_101911 [Ruegeria faecimaris]